jgi:hypothetical protein
MNILKAHVVANGVPSTQYVLVLSTATGAHVTYWDEKSLLAFRDKITETVTGLVIATDPPSPNGADYGN